MILDIWNVQIEISNDKNAAFTKFLVAIELVTITANIRSTVIIHLDNFIFIIRVELILIRVNVTLSITLVRLFFFRYSQNNRTCSLHGLVQVLYYN